MLRNAKKFKEDFIIYLNSLAFSLQTSFINFKVFLNNGATAKSPLFSDSPQSISLKHF